MGLLTDLLGDGNATSAPPQHMFKSGSYYAARAYASTTGATVLDRINTSAFVVDEYVTIDRIGVEVTTVGAAGALVRLGIYSDDGASYPGGLLLDAGTVDSAASTGFKELVISQALPKGVYWLAAVSQSATCTLRLHSPVAQVGTSNALTVSQNILSGWQQTGVSGALPATFSTTQNPSGGAVPRIIVRAA